jgi:hypothetical protein
MWLPPLSVFDLRSLAASFPSRFPFIRPTAEAIQFNMAATVLRALLGDDWCEQNVVVPGASDQHLSQGAGDASGRMKAQARIVALAELLFNLQAVPNAFDRFERAKRSDLEITMAELEAARLLALNNVRFGFVVERGSRYTDYDLEVQLRADRVLCCETKCKVGSTPLTAASILNSLKTASRQLPPTKPGLIFVKYPDVWISNAALESAHLQATDRFFRGSRRVVAIVVHWEEWHHQPSGALLRVAKYREIPNTGSRFDVLSEERLLRPWSPLWSPKSWTSFREILGLKPAG